MVVGAGYFTVIAGSSLPAVRESFGPGPQTHRGRWCCTKPQGSRRKLSDRLRNNKGWAVEARHQLIGLPHDVAAADEFLFRRVNFEPRPKDCLGLGPVHAVESKMLPEPLEGLNGLAAAILDGLADRFSRRRFAQPIRDVGQTRLRSVVTRNRPTKAMPLGSSMPVANTST